MTEFTIIASLLGAFVTIGIASLAVRSFRESRRDRARERYEETSERLSVDERRIQS